MTEAGQSQSGQDRNGATCALLSEVFNCPLDLADTILLRGRIRQYPGRATIVRQGDRISTLYVVVNGRAHEIVYSLDGQLVLLHEYRRGDFFGVVSPPYSTDNDAEIVAMEELTAFLLEGTVLALLAEQHGCIDVALLSVMVERLRRTTSRMYELLALSAVGRVYKELLRQARESPDLTIRPSPILSDLALHVSTTRETASRAVSALERRGIIRRDRNALTVVAPHRLEELIM